MPLTFRMLEPDLVRRWHPERLTLSAKVNRACRKPLANCRKPRTLPDLSSRNMYGRLEASTPVYPQATLAW